MVVFRVRAVTVAALAATRAAAGVRIGATATLTVTAIATAIATTEQSGECGREGRRPVLCRARPPLNEHVMDRREILLPARNAEGTSFGVFCCANIIRARMCDQRSWMRACREDRRHRDSPRGLQRVQQGR